MVRVFISIDFEDKDILNKIEILQKNLQETGAHLKPVKLGILHITLEFLGEVKNNQINTLKRILDSIEFEKIKLEVRKPGVLPSEKYIRVVYCEIEGNVDTLKKIQRDLRLKLKKNSFKVDSRTFKPHLTIARVKSAKNKEQLVKLVKEHKDFICGEQVIESIKLKQSILKKEGPTYLTLHEVKAKTI